MNLPADACPQCDPGIPPAAPAQNVSASHAAYRCRACGFAWITRWDATGWPVERSAAA